MKKALVPLLLCVISPLFILAQETSGFGIKFSGFVKTDVFWDSRQTVSVREGHFNLYPKNKLPDLDGKDINARSNFNMLSIQTRLKGTITGPDALGAKTSGVIEGAFFGHSDGDINGFRLRHAFVKLSWTHTELLVGQYWHPMFIAGAFPGVVSFNTGAPFQPFSRNPQIRLSQDLGKFRIIATALSQLDFKDTGPNGLSSEYLRNSAIPELNLRFEFHNKNDERGCALLAGIGGNYKVLTPRLETDSTFKTSETVDAYSGMFYAKWKNPLLTVKLEAVYGQMFYNLTMLGGYAVEDVTDPTKDFRSYSPVNTLSFWGDIHTNGKKWQVGLFGGYSKNMGAGRDLYSLDPEDYYSRGSNIAYLYRISPRFVYNAGKFRIAPEIEYTVAAYGKTDVNGEVIDSEEVANFRALLGVYYFF